MTAPLALRCRSVVVLTILTFAVYGGNSSIEPRRRFEYKLSFKGPHLVQRDGSIPFWTHGGHSIASDDSIRITPSLKSKKGYVWSNEKNIHPFWEVDMVFRVSGRGRIGADGLALWYTAEKGMEGPVFGSNDNWNGLAIFFDSFDNDNQHNNPYVMVMVNDGTQSYSHETDGSHQQLGGCLRDFRNKPFPVRIKVQYYQKALTVWYQSGMSDNANYELCMRAESVELPAEGYFGVSAATGGLADDHDVHSFLTHSLSEPHVEQPGEAPGTVLPEEDLKKYEAEFDEYGHKLEQAREEYQKDHPEAKHQQEQDENVYESQDIRELNLIYAGQNAILETVNELRKKMDNLISRNDRIATQIDARGGGVRDGAVTGDAIHQIEELVSNQKQLTQSLTDMRAVVDDMSSRIVQTGLPGQGSDHKLNDAILSHISSLQNDIRVLSNKPGSNCPQTSCVTTFYLFLLMSGQIAAGIVYVMYKNHKEAAAKKFY